ncbi:MAG: efflux RND transporter permease subunit [Vicinamibacterales bacterium]
MSIPRTAIERPVMMFMMSAVIIILGAMSLTRLPVDLMPEVSFPSISIRVGYSGVGPLEMEELVTRPIEQSVAAVAGLQQISSTSSEGSSNVRLTFAWGTDLNEAADDVRSRIDRVRGRLPEDADPPTIFKFDSTAESIMSVGVESDGRYDRVMLRELAEQDLSPRLERVPGVAAVTVSGGLRRQIHVRLSKEKIVALDLPVSRITSVLRTENSNTPLGEVAEGDIRYLLRSQGQFESLDEVRNLVVMARGGVPIYLKDIAEVVDTTEEERSILRINGKPGVRLQITKQSGTNTVAVAQGIRDEIERVNREVPGVQLMVLDDSSVFIQRSIDSVKEAAYLGAVFVVAVIFLFLRNWRSTIIICTSIPISIVGTFALLYFAGFTLNTMTFGGLALGIGMIVDASIVVLENTYRHMEQKGKDKRQAAVDGSEEVWSAILASILTHIAVFVPMLFLTGVSSIMFKQLAYVVMFSLMMSLFVAVTIVPVLCSLLLKSPGDQREHHGFVKKIYDASERSLDWVDGFYRRVLHNALVHRPTVLTSCAALFAASIAILMAPPGSLPRWLTINTELMSSADEGQVSVSAELPVGTRYERSTAVALRLEEAVRQLVPEAESIITSAGGGGGGFGGGGGNRANLQIRLVPKTERKRSSEQIAMDLRRQLSGLPGVLISARASGANQQSMRIFRMGGGNTSRLSLEIRGQDLEQARLLAARAKEIMDDTPGLADVRVGREEGRPELAVRVDRPKAAILGLRQTDIASSIQTAIAGTTAAQFREHGWEYPIIVRLRPEDRERAVDVEDVRVSLPSGQVLQARNLVDVRLQRGPVQIERKNQQRIVYVNAEIETALSEAIANVQARIPEMNIPQGFSVGFGQEAEEQQRAFNQLRTMLILALVLVYAVMASQYESLRDPFIIMFSVPVAAVGVVGTLILTGTPFNMQGYIGVVMLAGIVVSNGILLVDYTNTLRRRDKLPLREAVELGGRTRLRPILMTSLTTVLGLVPMALALGEGSEMQAPLARVVIGGLVTSTLITLVLVPIVYTLFEEGLAGLRRGMHHRPSAGNAATE